MDNGETTLAICLDLFKAFDTLDNSVLLSKLKYYGLGEVAMKWLNSYLSSRNQCVPIDDIKRDDV